MVYNHGPMCYEFLKDFLTMAKKKITFLKELQKLESNYESAMKMGHNSAFFSFSTTQRIQIPPQWK